MTAASSQPVVQVGLAGLGTAGRVFVPAFAGHDGFRLVAFAEPDESTRAAGATEFGLQPDATLDAMLAHAGLDAVCIATPTAMHAAHVVAALDAGKHVIVEKPMAITLSEAHAMVDAAERSGRVLLVGHSHSYDAPIQRMRTLIAGGELGRVRMINTWNFTDWVYRPRRPDELVTAKGGGVTYRQGAHQFDILRLLGGGRVRSVRAQTFDWDPERPVLGAHAAFLEFDDGTAATAVYNGYGAMPGPDLVGGVGEWGFPHVPAGQRSAGDEADAKRQRAKTANRSNAPFQPHFGLTVVSCERGDIRQSQDGLIVYRRDGREDIELPTGISPYDHVVAEFYDAATGRAPALHNGQWGLANLEVCAAAIRSAELGEAVQLQHQVAVPA